VKLWNIKLRLLIGGSVLIVLSFVLYVARGVEAALVLPVVGIVLLISGILYKPGKKKTENITSDTT